MQWPTSWLTILIGAYLHRQKDRFVPHEEVMEMFCELADNNSIQVVLLRMFKSGLLNRRGTPRNLEARLSKTGVESVGAFLKVLENVTQ